MTSLKACFTRSLIKTLTCCNVSFCYSKIKNTWKLNNTIANFRQQFSFFSHIFLVFHADHANILRELNFTDRKLCDISCGLYFEEKAKIRDTQLFICVFLYKGLKFSFFHKKGQRTEKGAEHIQQPPDPAAKFRTLSNRWNFTGK